MRGLQHEGDRENSLVTICNLYKERLCDDAAGDVDPEEARVFREHIPTIVRLSINCPYDDVRETLKALLEDVLVPLAVKVQVTNTTPSTYVPESQVPAIDTEDEAVRAEFVEAFAADGRVSNMTRLMACHHEFLSRFRVSHNHLMWDPGALSIELRHMIAIMAASRHSCQYLADIHRRHFLDVGGDPDWLKGPEHLPPKLKNLLLLNQLLAHQPWRVKSMINIGNLVQSGAENWSLNELVHAMLIMAHFHSLACFVFGCGIVPEIDFIRDNPNDDDATAAATEGDGATEGAAAAAATTATESGDDATAADAAAAGSSGSEATTLAAPSAVSNGGGSAAASANASSGNAASSEEEGSGGSSNVPESVSAFGATLAKLKERLAMGADASKDETKEANLQNFAETDTDIEASKSPQQQAVEVGPTPVYSYQGGGGSADADGAGEGLDELIDGHVDFNIRSKEYSLFRVEVFSWSDQGYATLSRYYPDLAEILEAEFAAIKELAYGFMGEEQGIDTFKFRWAIWNYVLRIKGIVDEEYAYSEVNTLLTRSVKSYIKTMVCYPQLTTFGQWNSYLQLLDSEKIHVCLLAMEARKQAELLYGLQAILQFTTSSD